MAVRIDRVGHYLVTGTASKDGDHWRGKWRVQRFEEKFVEKAELREIFESEQAATDAAFEAGMRRAHELYEQL